MMTDAQLSLYDILGVPPGASADEVRWSYNAKMAVLAPSMISGAPSKVIATADRARAKLDLARRTLSDPAARQLHDTEIGILRPGTGLDRPPNVPSEGRLDLYWPSPTDAAEVGLSLLAEALAPRSGLSRRVMVPDARSLFAGPARRAIIRCGLHAELVPLSQRPLPVEGLVIDQSARPGTRVRRSSTITLHVWHPSQRR